MNPLPVASVLLGAVLLLSGCASDDTEPSSASTSGPTVTTELLTFEPEKLTVRAGTTVTWRVSDNVAHTVTTGTFELDGDGLRTSENPDGVVDSPISAENEVSHTFAEPGTYTYYCSIHQGMSGVVEVTK